MVVGAAIPGAGEVKLVCSLLEVVVSDEVVVNYVTSKFSKMRSRHFHRVQNVIGIWVSSTTSRATATPPHSCKSFAL